MEDLLENYKSALKYIEAIDDASEEDKALLNGMASNLRYSIEWMNSGRRPGNKRGIERRAAYQREKPIDPLVMQKFFKSSNNDPYTWIDQSPISVIAESDKERIMDALCVLTDKEREMYLMSRGHCLTYSQIAGYFVTTRSAVQNNVERAEKKISKRINSSLFCSAPLKGGCSKSDNQN
ncbi:sigma factor-like helix-turn-helix DNA-binding protein [Fictibacillus norfolkensis]|uniref:Fis family transcriptional regulator n=1 Tax=Fictibacillus norfolkensis TaxID=2762233 RepID=A0ABR8ST45_9BACL|nr:sigma factor-like helix-turn-helix DNA-binding protein [Fictibacillus norfolkensis]MBD7966254.1 Fis family transcriptional regulator [Fictibacillus norfolkensis]